MNEASPQTDGAYVLYWMTAARRTQWNFALDRAADWCRALNRPLLVLEALRCDYRWASDRLHRFVLEGMRINRERLEAAGIRYLPYVEPTQGAGKGLLGALAQEACAVVTDDFPAFFLPRMVAAAARRVTVAMEAVDGNGLLPCRTTDRAYPTAYAFRRFLQRELPRHLPSRPTARTPRAQVLSGARIPRAITGRWAPASAALLRGESLANLPIDHDVAPTAAEGGASAGTLVLRDFLGNRLDRYGDDRNRPEEEVTSNLSPYLHFGHVSAHQVFWELMGREGWEPDHLSPRASGKRTGWWRVGEAAEGFLDQLVTWREVGLNFCTHREDYDRYDGLPDWARTTLAEHASDPRAHAYTYEQFDGAATHDALWNAAQNQLRREGRIHNYLRMLWGKKILEWSPSPQEALQTMIALNDRYALDGRDPNSYSGICWVLGRYDRPWGPERPIFGKIRYMSSANTARKVRVRDYVARYAP